MDVEEAVARRIGAAVGLPAYLDVPEDSPEEFVTVEQTGGGGTYMDAVRLDVDCWAKTRKRAKAVSALVQASVADLDDEPNVFNPRVENVYRMNDPDTGRPRYVVSLSLWVCE